MPVSPSNFSTFFEPPRVLGKRYPSQEEVSLKGFVQTLTCGFRLPAYPSGWNSDYERLILQISRPLHTIVQSNVNEYFLTLSQSMKFWNSVHLATRPRQEIKLPCAQLSLVFNYNPPKISNPVVSPLHLLVANHLSSRAVTTQDRASRTDLTIPAAFSTSPRFASNQQTAHSSSQHQITGNQPQGHHVSLAAESLHYISLAP